MRIYISIDIKPGNFKYISSRQLHIKVTMTKQYDPAK